MCLCPRTQTFFCFLSSHIPCSFYSFLHLFVHLPQQPLLIKGFHDLPWLGQIIPLKVLIGLNLSLYGIHHVYNSIFLCMIFWLKTFNWIKSHGQRKHPSYHYNWHSNRYAYSWYTININSQYLLNEYVDFKKIRKQGTKPQAIIELKASKCRNCILVPDIWLNVYICKYTLPKQILLKYPNEDVCRTMEPNTQYILNQLQILWF